MDWIAQKVNDGIFGTVSKIATDFLTWAFKLMIELILNLSDLKAYFDYNQYLLYAQIIAGSLLVCSITFQGIKSLAGNMFPGAEEHSMSTYTGRVIFAGMFIYLLPWSVQNVFMEINNAIIGILNSIPLKYEFTSAEVLMAVLMGGFGAASWTFLAVSLIIVIGFFIIGVMAGIRYIELLIAVILAPFAAISFVNKAESLSAWLRDTASIVFTQSVQVMLLKILGTLVGTVKNPIVLPLLVIGVIVIMIRGPHILRKLMFTTGTGSSAISALGGAGRMATMRFIVSK